jgi:hypothetical protein
MTLLMQGKPANVIAGCVAEMRTLHDENQGREIEVARQDAVREVASRRSRHQEFLSQSRVPEKAG